MQADTSRQCGIKYLHRFPGYHRCRHLWQWSLSSQQPGEILHHYLSTNSSLPSDYLSTVQFDTDRDLWIGTMDNQLLQLEHPTRQWKSYNVIKARCIAQKDAHTIAVGTVDGLVLINKQTGKQAHIFKSTDNKGRISMLSFNP